MRDATLREMMQHHGCQVRGGGSGVAMVGHVESRLGCQKCGSVEVTTMAQISDMASI